MRRRKAFSGLFAVALAAFGFAAALGATERAGTTGTATSTRTSTRTSTPTSTGTATGVLRVHFYDVGQGLAALVDLPDGHHLMLDTGDSARRAGCGDVCATAERHLLDRLRADLAGAAIDVLWITHPHSDHVGAAGDVIDAFPVKLLVDNGRAEDQPEVVRAHRAARDHGTELRVVDPDHPSWPGPAFAGVEARPVLPARWPAGCARDANECSIALRLDYRASSALFMGDAEHAEEGAMEGLGPVTLLQVGHHGSATSTSPAFLMKTRPRYAVISVGRPGEGLNAGYCLPRALVVRRLTRVLGGPGLGTLDAFDGDRCDGARPGDWTPVATSERLWSTERDGDVVLSTSGDGAFTRE